MRRIFVITAVIVFISQISFGQFKDIPTETKTKLKSGNLWFGFINPKNFSLKHSFSVQYITYGGNSVSLTSYTGTLSYKILENLQVSADVSMQYSPFASLNSATPSMNREFQNSLTGVYLSRVSLAYKPAKNVFINIDYVNSPFNYYHLNDHYSLWNDF
jgi:hypothetical protein